MTLTDFLLARIAEDEADAYAWDSDAAAQVASMWTGPEPGYATVASRRPASGWFADGREIEDARHVQVLYDPARVLAECAAKRRIVALHSPLEDEECDPSCGDILDPCWTLAALALPFADHEDYDESWRP